MYKINLQVRLNEFLLSQKPECRSRIGPLPYLCMDTSNNIFK